MLPQSSDGDNHGPGPWLTIVLAAGLLLTLLRLTLQAVPSLVSGVVGWLAYAAALAAYLAVGMPQVRAWLARNANRPVWVTVLLVLIATSATAVTGVWDRVGGLEAGLYLLGLLGLGTLLRDRRDKPGPLRFRLLDAAFLPLAAIPIVAHGVPMWSMPPLPVVEASVLGPGPIVPLMAVSVAIAALTVVGRLPDVGLTWTLRSNDVTLAVACYAAFVLIFGLPLGLITGLAHLHVAQWSALEAIGSFCSLYFYPAMLEEFYFRGILLNLLAERIGGAHGKLYGALISAALFGLLHLRRPHPLAYAGLAFVAGLFYSLAYLRTGRLSVPALTHALVDFTWIAMYQG